MTMWRGSGPGEPNRPGVTPSKVLLTGATGFIGRHVLANLLAQGIIVRTVGRRPPPDVKPSLVDHVTADISQDFSAAAEGCDCVIHLAGLADASSSFDRPVEFATPDVNGTMLALEC